MLKKTKNYTALITWIVSLIAIGNYIGFSTKNRIASWYQHIIKSPLTPPDITFGIVWTILYILIGYTGWKIWHLKKNEDTNLCKKLYILQIVLNWVWTPLFFYKHDIGASFICVIGLALCVLLLMLKVYSYSLKLLFCLLPYLLWLLFASYLNGYIWWYN